MTTENIPAQASTLSQQVANAQAEIAQWTPPQREIANLDSGTVIPAQASDEPMRAAFLSLADDDGFRLVLSKYNVGELSEADFIQFLDSHVRQAQAAVPVIPAAGAVDDAKDAARWRMCLELCHTHSDENGEFLMVQLPQILGMFKSTDEHFNAAIDAAISAQQGPEGKQ